MAQMKAGRVSQPGGGQIRKAIIGSSTIGQRMLALPPLPRAGPCKAGSGGRARERGAGGGEAKSILAVQRGGRLGEGEVDRGDEGVGDVIWRHRPAPEDLLKLRRLVRVEP